MIEPATPASEKNGTLPASTAPAPLHESRLVLALCAVLTIFLQIYNSGYVCFRIDHISQIPLLYLKQDPTLYLNDWFLHGYGHFDLRKYHLLLMTIFSKPLGLPLGILAIYFIVLAATIWAWYAISKKVYGSSLPGLVAGVFATFLYGQELGSNHPFEKELIPRTEAYPFAWFGVYCALAGRPFLAGLLMAIAGIFQPAVGLLFALPVLIWLASCAPRPRLKTIGLFLAGFVLPFSYRVFSLREAIQDNEMLSASEEILLAAYIRHPHHMIPHLWEASRWLIFAAFFALFVLAWRAARRERNAPNPLAQLAWIIIAVLAVCTFFIEVVPLKLLILLQPWRMAVPLYVLMMLVSAPYLLGLLRRPEPSARMRALLILLSATSRIFFTLMVTLEIIFFAWERRRRIREAHAWVAIAAAIVIAILLKNLNHAIDDDLHHIYRSLPPLALALIGAGWLAARARLPEKPRLVQAALGAAVLAGFGVITFFFFIPESWLDKVPSRKETDWAALCWDYEFKPVPIKSLERVGAWAGANTPKDALFIIPPAPNAEGFQIWSRRAAVFCFKYIPLKSSGLKEWKERYLALHGIEDPNAPASQAEARAALEDYGGLNMDKVYDALTAPQALGIARKYKADYIASQRRYDTEDAAHFKYLYEAYTRGERKKTSRPLCVFKITQ